MLARTNQSKINEYKSCDTIFYQGANSSQTQVLNYTGDQIITATTGEKMWCTGRNNLKPLNVIFNLHIGPEIADVNLQPYENYYDCFNPLKWVYTVNSWGRNYLAGAHIVGPTIPTIESIKFHTPNLDQMSYGQESDIDSHYQKYLSWKENKTNDDLILYGVSRGTAATFCAFAKYQYPEVKLIILEGAIDSMENVMRNLIRSCLVNETLSNYALESLRSSIAFLNRNGLFGYREDSDSPLKLVEQFPENVPVVFITSEIDGVVLPENTQNIAAVLNDCGKNDVYVLSLKNSRHPYYMYDDQQDRDQYEAFIHAVYKKYSVAHDAELAKKGEALLETCCLPKPNCKKFATSLC